MGQSRSAAAVRRIVLVHVRHVVYRDASGLTATACPGHGRFGTRRTRNKAADAAESVDAHLRDHVRVLWGRARRVGVGSHAIGPRRFSAITQDQLKGGQSGPRRKKSKNQHAHSNATSRQDYAPHDTCACATANRGGLQVHTLSMYGTMSSWLSWSWLCLTTCAMNGWSVPEGAP